MKHLYILAICLLSAATALAQQTHHARLTAEQWREDLQFLKHTVHGKYPNLFHKVTADQFDAAVAALDKKLPELKDYEVMAEMSKIVAMFRIGHTQLSLTGAGSRHQETAGHGLAFSHAPVQFYWFSDGLYVKSAHKDYARAVGGKVLKIGKLETAQALEAIRPYTVYENEQGFESNAPYYLSMPELLQAAGISDDPERVAVVLSKNGTEESVVFATSQTRGRFGHTGLDTPADWVDAAPTSSIPLWRREPTAYRYMEWLKDSKTLYVRHSVTLNDGDQTIKAFFENMLDFIDKNEVEKLVLDVRMNGGGNNYLNKPILTSIIAARKINQRGKFFCIIGRRTFSACQNLVNELEKYTEVTFVGEPTSENVNFYGDTKTETLPNSRLEMYLSWMWWQNLDPRDKRTAMNPHLAVQMRFADYQTGHDPAMNVVQQAQATVNIEEDLKNLVVQGKYDEAVRQAQAYLNNPLHHYFKGELETKINEFGYTLINRKDFETANKVLKMNVQLFPESANVYDSYAESFMHMGNKAEAIKYYEMAIAKDEPNGQTAENAKQMIRTIKEK